MNLLEIAIAFLAPHVCLQCGVEGNTLCRTCIASLPPPPARCYRCTVSLEMYGVCPACRVDSPCSRVVAATSYAGVARQLVQAIKFERAAAAAENIAWAMAPALLYDNSNWIVTHAPTAYTRVRQRGYDQAQLIARQVARQLRVPYVSLLARTGAARQLGQTRAVRQQQMTTAFRVLSPALVVNKRVVVIDDVITTGSTLESAARLLTTAGAQCVHAAAFAAA